VLFDCVGLTFPCLPIFLALKFSSMAPNARSLAALRREAAKRREINPKEVAELVTDPSFVVECSHVNLLGDPRSGSSTSKTPGHFNASLQHSVLAVTPTAHSHAASSSSPISLTTENALANSKRPQFFVNPTRGSHNVKGDPDLSPDWEYREVSSCPISLTVWLIFVVSMHMCPGVITLRTPTCVQTSRGG
jgi:hypothetical protein